MFLEELKKYRKTNEKFRDFYKTLEDLSVLELGKFYKLPFPLQIGVFLRFYRNQGFDILFSNVGYIIYPLKEQLKKNTKEANDFLYDKIDNWHVVYVEYILNTDYQGIEKQYQDAFLKLHNYLNT